MLSRGMCGAQHKLSMALKEFRVMHAAAARGNLPHHQLIYPPSLRYLPVWTLGALAHSEDSVARSSSKNTVVCSSAGAPAPAGLHLSVTLPC